MLVCSAAPGPLHTHMLHFLGRMLASKPHLVADLRAAGIWELAYGHRFFWIGDQRFR